MRERTEKGKEEGAQAGMVPGRAVDRVVRGKEGP